MTYNVKSYETPTWRLYVVGDLKLIFTFLVLISFFLSYNETQISWQEEMSYKNIYKEWLCNIDDEGRINFVVVF